MVNYKVLKMLFQVATNCYNLAKSNASVWEWLSIARIGDINDRPQKRAMRSEARSFEQAVENEINDGLIMAFRCTLV